jgi:hypothetical protein
MADRDEPGSVPALREEEPQPRRYGGERRRQADTIVVKVKAPPAARGLRTVARARAAADIAATAAIPPALAQLIETGRVRQAVPVLPPVETDASSPHRALMAAVRVPRRRRAAAGLVVLSMDPGTNAEETAAYLHGQEGVEYAFVPPVKRLFMPPRRRRRRATRRTGPDPLASRQWAHGAVHIHEAREHAGFKDAADVVVAVVDSGIDRQHPDLRDSLHSFKNYVSAETDKDLIGHGTHVAGIIAAGRDNAVGVAGLCAAKIMAIKALPVKDRNFDAKEYYRALNHAIEHGAQVLNLSLGGEVDPAERDIIEDALDAGVVVVAAVGNEYEEGNPIEYPAAYKGVIGVGASDEMDRRASFSNTGPQVALLAPGVSILSTTPHYPSQDAEHLLYDSWPGTSMAAPHVAAAAALLLARRPGLTPAEVKRTLTSNADRVPRQHGRRDQAHGYGRLNIVEALY